MVNDLLTQLQYEQLSLLEISEKLPDDYAHQFHADLSPAGWHLGHCVFTESYWLREIVMGTETINDELKSLYIPELSVKSSRTAALPAHDELCAWAKSTQNKNIDYLGELITEKINHELMQDDYLVFFLCQHYAQHIETSRYVLTQRNLQMESDFIVSSTFDAAALSVDYRLMEAATYVIGADNLKRHYDNECPAFACNLAAFNIAAKPVSNATFLAFMQDDGYQRQQFWQDQSWHWRQQHQISCPQHWRRDSKGNFYATGAEGPYLLQADAAVSGLSLHEARALACWAGARLPHEYEWEAAKKAGLLEETGQVWEWCANDFHPYAGFRAFPYDGYSLPWFDQRHFSLRGSSSDTRAFIRRDTFRNFYEGDKRHLAGGLRLVTA